MKTLKEQKAGKKYQDAKKIFAKLRRHCLRNNIAMKLDPKTHRIRRIMIAYTDFKVDNSGYTGEVSGSRVNGYSRLIPEIKTAWAKPIIQDDELVFYFKDEKGEDYVPAMDVLVNF